MGLKQIAIIVAINPTLREYSALGILLFPQVPLLLIHQWQPHGSCDYHEQPYDADKQAHWGDGLESFDFGHAAHFAHHPEAAVVHPGDRF
jgi:hypothetical protein